MKAKFWHPNGFWSRFHPHDKVVKNVRRQKRQNKNIRKINLIIDSVTAKKIDLNIIEVQANICLEK